jgi:hypothetical protein
MAEDADLPTPVGPEYKAGYDNLRTVSTRQYLTQESLDDSANDLGAIAQMATRIPYEVAKMHAFHIARNAWCSLGKLAVCGTTSSSATVVLATNSNLRRFHYGMVVDVVDTGSGAYAEHAADRSITAITEATPSITISGATLSTNSNDVVVVSNEHYDAGSTNYGTRAWNGIPDIVGTGDIHQITVSSYPEYQAKVGSSTGALTLAKMQAIVDEVEMKSEMGLDAIVTSPEVIQKYADILIPDIRYDPSALKRMEGGQPTNLFYRGGALGSIPIIKDGLCAKDEMYFINWSCFRMFTSAWLKWFAGDGSRLSRRSNKLGFETTYYSRGQLVGINRKGLGKLTGITI